MRKRIVIKGERVFSTRLGVTPEADKHQQRVRRLHQIKQKLAEKWN